MISLKTFYLDNHSLSPIWILSLRFQEKISLMTRILRNFFRLKKLNYITDIKLQPRGRQILKKIRKNFEMKKISVYLIKQSKHKRFSGQKVSNYA